MRSAKINAITPANEMPPDHSTAASGTLPTEQTKLSTAMIGPTITFSIVSTAGGGGETNSRSASPIRTTTTPPPMYSASVNCHPISTQSTSPSSQTRLVEANWKTSADAADAPFWKSVFPIATAAYEQDDEAAPSPVASRSGRGPRPASAA